MLFNEEKIIAEKVENDIWSKIYNSGTIISNLSKNANKKSSECIQFMRQKLHSRGATTFVCDIYVLTIIAGELNVSSHTHTHTHTFKGRIHTFQYVYLITA